MFRSRGNGKVPGVRGHGLLRITVVQHPAYAVAVWQCACGDAGRGTEAWAKSVAAREDGARRAATAGHQDHAKRAR